ncbi:MAG: hypothetical protein ABI347_10915 [Nitrososphaera sp.]
MKSLSVVIAALFAVILAFGVVPKAFANDMNAVLVPESNKAEGHFIGVKNLKLSYPEGSAIAKAFGDSDKRIQFTLNGTINNTDNGIANAIVGFNKAMLAAGSPVQATSMKLTYTGVVKPGPTSTLISYKIEAAPILEKFVLTKSADSSGDVVDLEWRGLKVTDDIVLNAPEVGSIEINKPIGLIQVLNADLARQIQSSQAASVFEEPIMDFTKFNQKMDTWHFLFDPSGSIVESSSFFKDTTGAKVVSIFSLGESSFREGTFEAEEKDAKGNFGGTDVDVHSQVPAPSGQIQIAGFAKLDVSKENSEFAIVSKDAPEGTTTATGGFPIQVLLVLGGMMGAIAVFILWKSRK